MDGNCRVGERDERLFIVAGCRWLSLVVAGCRWLSWFLNTDDFNPAYKFLGAAMSQQGYTVDPQVVDKTEEARALYAEGQAWLHEGS